MSDVEKAEPEPEAEAEAHPAAIKAQSKTPSRVFKRFATTHTMEFDLQKRQVFHGWQLVLLSFQSLGVIYGDIGTSMLYVYSSVFTAPPSQEEILCSLSMIIYALVIMVTLKYICLVLFVDDNGQGGTLALYSLISRYARITDSDPAKPVHMERHKTIDMRRGNRTLRSWMESSHLFQKFLTALALFGVCFVMSDGILTPSQSVLGAVQGANVVNSDLGSWTVVGITIAILVLLFAIQPFGLGKLSVVFAPIIALWLFLNFAFGIYNLARHDASVFKAFSPYYAGKWFTLKFENGDSGWHRLSGILLCFTGCEALYADISAFSRRAIQLSWFCYVFPCLLITYLGQTAYMMDNPEAYANPFFLCAPKGWLWPSLILSILAAIVASQALITGCFALLQQAINMSYFPRLTIKHTSTKVHGQIFISTANWLLMTLCIVVVVAFNNTTRLGNAYGLCVVIVTFITTLLMSIAALVVFRIHALIVFPLWLIFALYDGLYISAAIFKVPDGAYFTLITAGILAGVMSLWRFGKVRQWRQARKDRLNPQDVVVGKTLDDLTLTTTFGGDKLGKISGFGIFLDEFASGAPPVWIRFISTFRVAHSVTIFLNLRQVYAPVVAPEQRFAIVHTGIANTYRIIARFGYHERITNASLKDFVPPVRDHLERSLQVLAADSEEAANVRQELAILNATAVSDDHIAFILDKSDLRTSSKNIVIRGLHSAFCFLRDNTRTRPQFWRLPVDRMVEIGGVRYI